MRLIGLTGQKGVGKSMLASYLVDEHGFFGTAFAENLKEAARMIFGLSQRQMYTAEGKKDQLGDVTIDKQGLREAFCLVFGAKSPFRTTPMERWGGRPAHELFQKFQALVRRKIMHQNPDTPRRILQLLGTEVGRAIDDQLWIKSVAETIKRESPRRVVIEDARFVNEANWVRKKDGVIWEILRPGYYPDGDFHQSEFEMWVDDLADVSLVNAADPEALFAMTDTLLEQ